ncbi:MAG: 4-hydroxy-tetrahydrodipicolinate synthase [bacterium]|nr:4-hydroxy-tetrahydrodipicolinate synthase [bacterium]
MEIKGLYTALITPFSNGEVDYEKIDKLVDIQLEANVDGILPMGTTGESPTMMLDEHIKVVERVVNRVNGRCQIISGAGSNCTEKAVQQTITAKTLGVDATLQVAPYYNKPSQEGLYQHFAKIADVGLPVVLYNVPGRSGIPIEVNTISRLANHPQIAAIKEAAGSVERVSMILDECDITVLSGDDALTLPMMSVGATGVISVLSNLCPKPLKEMIDAFYAGDLEKAKTIHMKYYKLMRGMFIETNPTPVKAAIARSGLITEECRLPICPMSEVGRKQLFQIMDEVCC